MASIDIDSLRVPVDPDRPAGEDLEYDPLFTEMEQAAAGKPAQEMGDAVIEAEEPDWRLVQRNALSLLKRSKDLRVCVNLCHAALRNEGFEGFADSIRLASLLTAEFWGAIHPELDADDDDDPTARVNAVAALTAPAMLLAIERTPLISVPMLGAVNWAEIKPVGGDEDPRQASTETQAIINNCELDLIASRRTAVATALECCKSLETFITQQVGASRAPNLQTLRDLLKRIDSQLGRWWEERGGTDGDDKASDSVDTDSDDPANDEPMAGNREAAQSGKRSGQAKNGPSGPMGPITSRQEAIAAIDKILEYYQRHEPSSPLPLLLVRAKRLATKSFIEILQDLIPEGLGRAHEIGGLTRDSAGTSSSDFADSYPAVPPSEGQALDEPAADDEEEDFFN